MTQMRVLLAHHSGGGPLLAPKPTGLCSEGMRGLHLHFSDLALSLPEVGGFPKP